MDTDRPGDGAIAYPRPSLRLFFTLLLCAILQVGCQPYTFRDQQVPAVQPDSYTVFKMPSNVVCDGPESLAAAGDLLAAGIRHEAQGLDSCIDQYYRAALCSWRFLESSPPSAADPTYQKAWQIYHQSLSRLITAGCENGRLDPRGRLIVVGPNGRQVVPIAYHGFPWKPEEFCQLLRAGDFCGRDIQRHHQNNGIGISLVAIRQGGGDDLFYPPRQHFPATAVLRPASSSSQWNVGVPSSQSHPPDTVLDFYNPYLYDAMPVGSLVMGIERDLTAPFAALLQDTARRFTEGFVDPNDADVKPKLFMMEPYQRGKIPVVFIHGLWSDPVTWVDAVNDLRVQRDIYQQYQFWFFRYPTGRGLLISAADLREQLLMAREWFDPAHEDHAMDRIVLVGHSMGGLVAQLQVTCSHDVLWRHAAKQPLDAVLATPAMREQLRRAFFFTPSPQVRRVVFIGTPHRGSIKSRQVIGQLASSLVRTSAEENTRYRQLIDTNRDIFAEYLWTSWPTSIDLLEPSHPMLQALANMPFDRRVRLHSIVGTGGSFLGGEPSDGVVPVSSAQQAGVCSELHVPVRHEKLHRTPASVNDLARILREHAQTSD